MLKYVYVHANLVPRLFSVLYIPTSSLDTNETTHRHTCYTQFCYNAM